MPLLTPQLCYYGDAISGYHRLSDHAQAPVTRISGRWRAVAGIRPDYAKMFGLQSPDPRDEMRERREGERVPTSSQHTQSRNIVISRNISD